MAEGAEAQARQSLENIKHILGEAGRTMTNIVMQARENLIREFKRTRSIKPFQSNWLLFASIIEDALLELTGECDQER